MVLNISFFVELNIFYVDLYALSFASSANHLQPERCEWDPPWIKHTGAHPGECVCI